MPLHQLQKGHAGGRVIHEHACIDVAEESVTQGCIVVVRLCIMTVVVMMVMKGSTVFDLGIMSVFMTFVIVNDVFDIVAVVAVAAIPVNITIVVPSATSMIATVIICGNKLWNRKKMIKIDNIVAFFVPLQIFRGCHSLSSCRIPKLNEYVRFLVYIEHW